MRGRANPTRSKICFLVPIDHHCTDTSGFIDGLHCTCHGTICMHNCIYRVMSAGLWVHGIMKNPSHTHFTQSHVRYGEYAQNQVTFCWFFKEVSYVGQEVMCSMARNVYVMTWPDHRSHGQRKREAETHEPTRTQGGKPNQKPTLLTCSIYWLLLYRYYM